MPVFMLSIQLCRYEEYASFCGFNGKLLTGRPSASSLRELKPGTIEGASRDLRGQDLRMGLYGRRRVDVAIDSTFIHAYFRRKRKSGVSNRGARAGKVERTTTRLGWKGSYSSNLGETSINVKG